MLRRGITADRKSAVLSHRTVLFFFYRPLANGGKEVYNTRNRTGKPEKKEATTCTIRYPRNFLRSCPTPASVRWPCGVWTIPTTSPSWSRCWRRTWPPAKRISRERNPRETEDILPYRNAFTALGINPNKFLCSIEALLTRIAKGKGFPHINAAVDLGNAVSIKHRLPMGAHDLDTIDEGLDVRLAKEGDTFIPFGSTEEETPDIGEAVYASGSEIRTRRWTWRQSERGKITEETKAILFPIDGFSDVNADEVQAAADELAALLHRFFGDGIEIEAGVVTRDSPTV